MSGSSKKDPENRSTKEGSQRVFGASHIHFRHFYARSRIGFEDRVSPRFVYRADRDDDSKRLFKGKRKVGQEKRRTKILETVYPSNRSWSLSLRCFPRRTLYVDETRFTTQASFSAKRDSVSLGFSVFRLLTYSFAVIFSLRIRPCRSCNIIRDNSNIVRKISKIIVTYDFLL